MRVKNNYKVSVVIERDKNGYYAYCPQLQGCYTQGDTYEETIKNIKDAVRLHILDRQEENEKFVSSDIINLTAVEVSV